MRLILLVGICATACAAEVGPPEFPLRAADQAGLVEALDRYHPRYNPDTHLLRNEIGNGYNYHSNLRNTVAHSVRRSAEYAVALLDSGAPEFHQRALKVLDALIMVQDTDPKSPTRGVWPYYLEEPIPEMNTPDRNWADFISVQLLQARLSHGDRIPKPLLDRLDDSIRLAAAAVRRRNMHPGYTNIAIMGAFVTLATAELYEDVDLLDYATKRWSRFHRHTLDLGGFNEYNSPTYTIVALDELLRILQYVRDPEARRQAAEIYKIAWNDIAVRHHPPTGQWSGPHSRSYHTLLRTDRAALFDRVAGRTPRPHESDLESHRLRHECPDDLRPLFRDLTEPREVIQTFAKGEHPVIGTTWITPGFSLGTANRADLWNQRRPLLAYWGTLERPAYLRLRFLNDGYDFAAVQFFSAQQKNQVVAGINFATNGGNKHVSIDRIKDATIRTSDFRLRFELGGAGRKATVHPAKLPQGTVRIEQGDARIALSVRHARIGGMTGTWETGEDQETTWIDLVFHHGDPREIDFSALKEAVIGFALQCNAAGDPADADCKIAAGTLTLTWSSLDLSVPIRPDTQKVLQTSAIGRSKK